ncbi:hypothetical protein BP5796_01071 [Coleophoma crateriformis]|uniref:N-acetyltransferase domain-containing protein n=1 Tax=Coleophoma crateriformis TaxID=565419 RepID=A0A3D8TCF6_9HELO|nr:hypothetical protein BP5796_01071 [Coleophoma crateriformis]
MATPSEWYKDTFLISTARALLQPSAINAAFDSEQLYWAKALPEARLQKMLDGSLCFGVYALPQSSAEIAGRGSPKQIGLARLITDEVTFAWLTDVYILPEYQGKGLSTWLIECVNATLDSWPELRRAMLVTSSGVEFYEKIMGMQKVESGKGNLSLMGKLGRGSMTKE